MPSDLDHLSVILWPAKLGAGTHPVVSDITRDYEQKGGPLLFSEQNNSMPHVQDHSCDDDGSLAVSQGVSSDLKIMKIKF